MNTLISNENSQYIPQEKFMRLAIQNAKKAEAWTHPNPLVGAVIVKKSEKGEEVLAEGYHHNYGNLHAERDALKNAVDSKISVKNAILYVTLEPCCHYGKQPPCTQAIIESGIKTVVIGSRDPNPLVNGKGAKLLEEAGITVIKDFLRDECDSINKIFFHFIKHKTPYVIVKYAMSADGETSCTNGESKWITGEKARTNVHKTRANVMAVMTGINTVLKDDPMLNVRLEENSEIKKHYQPLRIVCDSKLKIPLESNLVKTSGDFPLLIDCSKNLDLQSESKKNQLESKGISVIQVSEQNGFLNLEETLKILAQKGIDSVLVESGGTLNGNLFFEKNLVNQVDVYVGAQIFGNKENLVHSPVQKKGVDFPKDSIKLSKPQIHTFEDDVLLRYFIDEN